MNKSTKRAPKINQPPALPTLHALPDTPAPKTILNSTVGLDLGDQHCYFCVLDQAGNMVSEGKIFTTPDALGQYFSTLASSRIAMETGAHSGWISRLAATNIERSEEAREARMSAELQSDLARQKKEAKWLYISLCVIVPSLAGLGWLIYHFATKPSPSKN
jgi:hypothetical protein